MKLTIKIAMDNAAFEEQGQGPEVSRILTEYIRMVRDCTYVSHATFRDSNGNTVGTAKVTK